MKKIKLLAIAVMLCAGSYFGYNAYNNATMTDEERLFLDNVEALAKHNFTSDVCIDEYGLYHPIGDVWLSLNGQWLCTCLGGGIIIYQHLYAD